MQCNRSDGHRFEGYEWEAAPITPIIEPRSKLSKCSDWQKKFVKPLQKGACDMYGECIYSETPLLEMDRRHGVH